MERIGNFFPGRFEKSQVVKGGGSVVQQRKGNGDLGEPRSLRFYLSLAGPGRRSRLHGAAESGKNKKGAGRNDLSSPVHDRTSGSLF